MTPTKKEESKDFYGLGIAPKLLEILEQLKFTTPTPIQFKSIPVALDGKDMVGIAQTGTGKTLAFGVPMLQRLAQQGGRGLVVLPTRELAQQVDENLKMIGKKMGLRTAVLIGGEAMGGQLKLLRFKPHVIIATPGRLIDHLNRKTVDLSTVKVLVLDEADLMFDMGFAPQLNEILKSVPKERQTMLFSATMPPEIMKIATEHMALPIRVEVAPAGTPAESVAQEMIIVRKEEKLAQLEKILKDYSGSVLIFARTKYGVKDLTHKIKSFGHSAAEIHSNRSLAQRREALSGFKIGRYRVLVATDIAARGIDVKGIELVLNYDLPDNTEDYVHRIGRTGRAGKEGRAISLATPSQIKDIRDIERMIKKTIPMKKLAPIELNRGDEKRRTKEKKFISKFHSNKQFSGGRRNTDQPQRRNDKPQGRNDQPKKNFSQRPSDKPKDNFDFLFLESKPISDRFTRQRSDHKPFKKKNWKDRPNNFMKKR